MIRSLLTIFNTNLRFTITVLVVSLFLSMISNGVKADTPPISLHTGNSHYFSFRGEPTILITSGEHYSAVQNLDFDYVPYLNELEDNGLNYTRIFNGTYVDGTPDDLPIINGGDVWIPVGGSLYPDEINQDKTKGFISPWARSNVAGYAGGGNKFDLDTWDTAYFNRLKDYVEKAGDRGIVVEVTFFCGFSKDYYWSLAPFNYQNNINNVGKFGGDYGPYDSDGSNIGYLYPLTMASEDDGLLAYFDDMIEKTIDELSVYDNVFFELANEPYYTDAGNTVINQNGENCGRGHGVSSEWQAHIAQTVIDKIATLSNDYLIAQNIDAFYETVVEIPSNTDPASVDDFRKMYPEIDIINFHYAARNRLYTTSSINYNYALNRPIGCDENGAVGYTDELYRKQAWNYITAGGAIFNNLDMSYSTDGHEGGQPTNPSYGFGGSPEYHEQLSILKEFIHDLDFVNMQPNNDLPKSGGIISSVSPTGIEVRCLADEGEQYAVFVEGGSVVYMTFDLPAGSYTADWINTKQRGSNGEIIIEKSQSFTHNGGSKSLGSPNYTENDIALRITNDSTYTSSDSGVRAHWKFDEGSGNTTLDHSNNSNTGSLINNPAWVDGVSEKALYYNGIDELVDCGTDGSMDMGSNDFTISAWINMGPTQQTYPTIVAKGAGSNTNAGYWFMVNNSKLKLLISDGATRITLNSNTAVITDTNWHHVAASIDRSGNVTFYLDTVSIGSADVSQFNSSNIVSSNSLTIGSWQTSSTSYLDGKIEDVTLIGSALSESEIAEIYNGLVTVEPDPDPATDPNALAQWNMDEGQGSSTADVTGNGNDGTLISNPVWVTGVTGNALDFDGTDDKVECGISPGMDMGTGDFTISGWINIGTSQNTYPTIVSKGAGSSTDAGYWIIVRYSRLWLFLSDGVTRITVYSDVATFNDDNWHHVAASIDRSGDVIFYLDTLAIGSSDVSQFDGQNITNTDEFTIGAWKGNTTTYINGSMDDVRLFPTALSAEEVATVYSGDTITVPDPDPDPVTDPNALAQWNMDEGQGSTTADVTGNGNDGTLISNPAWVTGVTGNALDFDGTDDKVECGISPGMDMGAGDFTISGWINIGTSQNTYPTIVSKGAGSNTDAGYWLIVRYSRLWLFLSDGVTRITLNSDVDTFNDNNWHHVAASIDRSGDVTFYLDTLAIGSSDVSQFDGQNITNTDEFTIAAWKGNTTTYINGRMDDIRLFPTALSAEEIATVYSGEGTPEPSPVAHWENDEGSGSTTSDVTLNGNDGTLINSPTWTAGISGNAISFDGVDDYVDCGAGSDLDMESGDFTIATWIIMDPTQSDNPTLVAKGAGASYDTGYWLLWNINKLRIYLSDGTARVAFDSDVVTLNDNEWHHVAVTINRDNDLTFYVDGINTGSVDVSAHSGKDLSSTKSFTFGSWQTSAETFLNGTLDDLRIYKSVLSESQVNYLYDLYSANKSATANFLVNNATTDVLNVYPNPSAGQITLDLSVSKENTFTITVFDIRGQKIATLFNDQLTEGNHQIHWDGKSASGNMIKAGMYFVRMVSSTSMLNKTIVIME